MTFKVYAERCNECLFSKAAIVSNERRADILKTCLRLGDEHYFVCHKATLIGEEVCCKGFHDAYPSATAIQQIAARLDAIEFVPLPSEENALK